MSLATIRATPAPPDRPSALRNHLDRHAKEPDPLTMNGLSGSFGFASVCCAPGPPAPPDRGTAVAAWAPRVPLVLAPASLHAGPARPEPCRERPQREGHKYNIELRVSLGSFGCASARFTYIARATRFSDLVQFCRASASCPVRAIRATDDEAAWR